MMKRIPRLVAAALLPAIVIGCESTGVVIDFPFFPTILSPAGENPGENPAFIPLAPDQYGRVFEKVWQTLGDYGFEIAVGDSNRYDGRIECLPRVAPGLPLLLKAGSPDPYERLLATTQTYRHRVTVLIQPANQGGFFVEFIVRKELEDIGRPARATVGGAVYRSENTVERQTEVISPDIFETNWIFKGRDPAMEQELIRRFKLVL